MDIDDLPGETLKRLKEKGFVQANRCFANCARMVFQLPAMDFEYVLCWLVDVHGQKHPHAVIGKSGKYYDPMLQGSPLVARYVHIESYSRAALIEAMVREGGQCDAQRGMLEGTPPALLADGRIRCIEVAHPGDGLGC
jgi:hypothetical protein